VRQTFLKAAPRRAVGFLFRLKLIVHFAFDHQAQAAIIQDDIRQTTALIGAQDALRRQRDAFSVQYLSESDIERLLAIYADHKRLSAAVQFIRTF
jgi:hypothetical protein